MAIILWKPFSAINIEKRNKDVVARMNVPGFEPKKIKVAVKNQMLHVSGAMEKKEEEKRKNYYRQEINSRSFEHAVSLPAEVEEKKLKIKYKNGVLEIVMPRKKVSKAAKKTKK